MDNSTYADPTQENSNHAQINKFIVTADDDSDDNDKECLNSIAQNMNVTG